MINKELIFLNSELGERYEVIENMAKKAHELGLVSDIQKYIEVVKEREETFSTAVGYGVSIPHGKTEVVESPFIGFTRMKTPFVWDAEQNEEVKLTFLLGVPVAQQGTLHLKILAQISRRLMREEFREALLIANEDEIYNILKEIEASVKED